MPDLSGMIAPVTFTVTHGALGATPFVDMHDLTPTVALPDLDHVDPAWSVLDHERFTPIDYQMRRWRNSFGYYLRVGIREIAWEPDELFDAIGTQEAIDEVWRTGSLAVGDIDDFDEGVNDLPRSPRGTPRRHNTAIRIRRIEEEGRRAIKRKAAAEAIAEQKRLDGIEAKGVADRRAARAAATAAWPGRVRENARKMEEEAARAEGVRVAKAMMAEHKLIQEATLAAADAIDQKARNAVARRVAEREAAAIAWSRTIEAVRNPTAAEIEEMLGMSLETAKRILSPGPMLPSGAPDMKRWVHGRHAHRAIWRW